MAHIYVDSNAVGAGTGANWANAYTTLEAAAEAAGTAAGDSIWVAQDHAETSASAVTITFKNTAAAPGTVMCVNKAGSVPPVAANLLTTATVTTTGNSNLSLAGNAYIYGIIFSAGTGAVAAEMIVGSTAAWLYFKSCALRRLGTSTAQIQVSGTGNRKVIFDNTTLQFGNVSDYLYLGDADFIWKNTPSAISGAIFPTELVRFVAASSLTVEGVDLSALSTGKTLVGTFDFPGSILFKNCKLGADVALAVAATSDTKARPIFINCDSGDTNYKSSKSGYSGTQSVETTAVLTNGASDGTTLISWLIATTADAELIAPFESLPIAIWNETIGAITVTVQGTWDQVAVPTNAQIWMEVEYLGTAGFPKSLFASCGPATILTAAANLAAGDGTWAAPADVYTKFKLVQAITTTKKGPITVKIYVAAPSLEFFIDPRIVLS